MGQTVAGILLTGNHAGRPTTGLMTGTLYACSTHGLVYQTTDQGATWGTWATLGTTLDFGESGDIGTLTLGATAVAGATGEVADAGHVHPTPSAATITAALDYGESGDIGVSTPGQSAVAGATGEVADAGHRHPRLTERVVYEFIMDGGGSTLTTGLKGFLYIPDAFTITGVVMGADQSGSAVVDLWVDSYANYPPTVADTITASAKPTISATTKSKDTTLTGWTTAVAADRWLGFNLDSVTSVQRLTIAVFGYRS